MMSKRLHKKKKRQTCPKRQCFIFKYFFCRSGLDLNLISHGKSNARPNLQKENLNKNETLNRNSTHYHNAPLK